MSADPNQSSLFDLLGGDVPDELSLHLLRSAMAKNPYAMPIIYATRPEIKFPNATVVSDIVKNSGSENTEIFL